MIVVVNFHTRIKDVQTTFFETIEPMHAEALAENWPKEISQDIKQSNECGKCF